MKKNILIIGIVVAVLVVGVLVWYFGFRPGPGLQEPSIGKGPGLLGPSIGKMTDELYIQIALEIASEAEKDPTWSASNLEDMEELLKKYGVTMEQYNAFAEQLLADPERNSRVTQEIINRVMEKAMKGIKIE